MISVLIAEDQAMVRGALAALLGMEPNIQVIGQVEDGKAALDFLKDSSLKNITVDIMLTDIEMPRITGIELAEKIGQLYPNTRTVIITTFGRAGYIRRAMAASVYAFLLKDSPPEKLAEALNRVMQGKKTIDPELAIAALDDKDPLSDKERKALRLAATGRKSSEIAAELFLSEGTVRNYLSEAIAKLNATNRIDAARIARQKGWL